MTNLTLDKIKAMLGAHNDGVFRLESRDNLDEIVGWLVEELEAAFHDITMLSDSRQDYLEERTRLQAAFRRFISQAMTFRKVNTDEWVEWFEDEAIAEAEQALKQQPLKNGSEV